MKTLQSSLLKKNNSLKMYRNTCLGLALIRALNSLYEQKKIDLEQVKQVVEVFDQELIKFFQDRVDSINPMHLRFHGQIQAYNGVRETDNNVHFVIVLRDVTLGFLLHRSGRLGRDEAIDLKKIEKLVLLCCTNDQ